MAVRELLKMGDLRLLAKAEAVSEPLIQEINTLVGDMRDTMHEKNGAGLAAPQLGVPLRMADMSKFGFEDALNSCV